MPRALATGLGVARGLEKATGTILAVQAARAKLEREKETDKVDKRLRDAQIKKTEFDITNAEEKARRDKDIAQKIFGERQAFGSGYQAGGENQVDYSEILPPGASYRSGGFTVTGGKPESKLTAYQKEQLAAKEKTSKIQKGNALDYINRVVNQASKSSKYSKKYTPGLVKSNLMKQFKGLDLTDPDIVAAIPESIDPVTGFEKFRGAQKYPQKKHPSSGRTYERREDGQWHLVEG